ncbi:MAG: hypothetical protein AAFO95_14310, partial [Cyanobacteria bacterium J06600_6]
IIFCTTISQTNAQNTESVTNNNNENVDVNVQEAGSQQQGQSANGGTSSVTVEDEEAKDNFWSGRANGQLVIPEGNAALTCGEQMISFSRSGGFSFGVGAASIKSSDNDGQIPEEFRPSLAAIQQCAKEKNVAEILEQYLKLAEVDKAIAQTYLRTVSPEIYATLFVENAKESGDLVSKQSYTNLTSNLRNSEFESVVEWQDGYYAEAMDRARVKLKKERELRQIERDKRLAELEVLELERRARETESIIKYNQSNLNNYLEKYQQQ